MKKLLPAICLLLTLSFVATEATAQTNTGFGIRGGMNFANLNDTDRDADSRTGLMVGVYTNFLIPNSPVSIQPEVLYTQKGFEVGDATYKLNYIEVPVLARFDFITDSGLLPHVYFGPYIGFNVNAEVEGSNQSDGADIDDSVKGTDFGVVVGGGVDFGRFDLGVRYNAGLTEVFDNGGSAKNGVIAITAGIGF